MKIIINPDEDHVNEVKQALSDNGGYCPCKIGHIPENKCMCQEFKDQISDSTYYGSCHCGLYLKVKEEQD